MTPEELRATVRAHVARGRVGRALERRLACEDVATLLEAHGAAGPAEALWGARGAVAQRAALAAGGRWADDYARRGSTPPAGLDLLSAAEVAAWAGVSGRTVSRWLAARVIVPVYGPGVLRYRREDVGELIEIASK